MKEPKDLTCLSMMDLLTAYRHPIAAEVAAIVPDGDPVAEMIRYHLGLDQGEPSGKYVRSVLCLAMCQAWGGDYQKALPGGAAVELIHRCSLIFDDIQDQSEYRNGRLALWKTVGPARALNAGLALSCLPRIALHRIRGGMDADTAVRVDGACWRRLSWSYAEGRIWTCPGLLTGRSHSTGTGKWSGSKPAC